MNQRSYSLGNHRAMRRHSPANQFAGNRECRFRPGWAFVTTLASTCLSLMVTTPALAQSTGEFTASSRNEAQEWKGFLLKRNPGWSIGLEPYAGIAVLVNSDETRGHGITGGVSRVRIGYVEFGASLELSDVAIERWRQLGVFVGAFLPMVNWIDFDTSIGIAQRAYLSSDTRYGPGGFDVRGAALTYRLGFSDRILDDTFGLRLGGALLVSGDLSHHEVPWLYEVTRTTVSGSTPLGGVSIALAVCLGFDVAFGGKRPAR